MKSVFPEWYDDADPDKVDVAALLTSATIAFDASALLELYRSQKKERAQILDTLQAVADRLFVPYQAALEYQRGRKGAIADHQQLLDGSIERLKEAQKSATKPIKNVAVGKRVRAAWETAHAGLADTVEQLHDEYGLTVENDDVRDTLDALLTADRLGTEPTQDQIQRWCAEFDRRAPMEIPPGYSDAWKGAPKMYGDYFIWRELLGHAITTNRSIMFVSNDQKSDWMDRRTAPLRELVNEMRSTAGVRYHHITLKQFTRLAQEHLAVEVDDETIDQIDDTDPAVTTVASFAAWLDAHRRDTVDWGNLPSLQTAISPEFKALLDNPPWKNDMAEFMMQRALNTDPGFSALAAAMYGVNGARGPMTRWALDQQSPGLANSAGTTDADSPEGSGDDADDTPEPQD